MSDQEEEWEFIMRGRPIHSKDLPAVYNNLQDKLPFLWSYWIIKFDDMPDKSVLMTGSSFVDYY